MGRVTEFRRPRPRPRPHPHRLLDREGPHRHDYRLLDHGRAHLLGHGCRREVVVMKFLLG